MRGLERLDARRERVVRRARLRAQLLRLRRPLGRPLRLYRHRGTRRVEGRLLGLPPLALLQQLRCRGRGRVRAALAGDMLQ